MVNTVIFSSWATNQIANAASTEAHSSIFKCMNTQKEDSQINSLSCHYISLGWQQTMSSGKASDLKQRLWILFSI